MRLEIYRTLWGYQDNADRAPEVFDAARAAGYDGVCLPLALVNDVGALVGALDATGLRLLPQVFTYGRTIDDHLATFAHGLGQAARLRPRVVVAQSGRDSFSEEQAVAFFEGAVAIEDALGVRVGHETHRGRILYNPWVTARMMDRFPSLMLNCDLSHWVCVTERLLDHEADIVEQCAARALHFDARVGQPEAPQVADPRSPASAAALAAHERWWAMIWEAHEQAGREVTSCTTEFGPPPYQPLGLDDRPLGDREALNDWMASRLRQQFAAREVG